MGELAELIARVEAASGPSYELDVLIAKFVGWTPTGNPPPPTGAPSYWYGSAFGMPAYSRSLDAVVALVEAKLPAIPVADHERSEIRLQIGDFGAIATISRDTFSGDYNTTGQAKTAPLALLLAFLKANQSEDNRADD